MQANKVSVKLYVGDELRRFYFEGTSFSDLKATCKTFAPESGKNRQIQLQYQDDENEWVTFSSDAELLYALGLVEASPLKLLRLRLIVTEGVTEVVEAPAVETNPNEEGEEDEEEGEIMITRRIRGRGRGRGRFKPRDELVVKKKLLDAKFVGHATFPDNTNLPVNSSFDKTWTIYNSGLLILHNVV